MAETLLSLPQIATKSQPSRVETSMDGLKKPFVLKGMEPFEKSRTAQAMQVVKEKFYRARMNGKTEFTTLQALDHLYANQAGTHQPELANAVLEGILSLTKDGEVIDHGGATRRLCSPTKPYEPSDDSFAAHFRWKKEDLLKINRISEIPDHEVMAEKVLTNLSHPHNMDWKAAIKPEQLPQYAEAVQTSVIKYLKEGGFTPTLYEAPDKSWVEIHVNDVDAFWHDIPVLGFYFPHEYNTKNEDGTYNLRTEEYAFYFGPEEKPDKFVIRIGVINPQGNPNMTNLHVAMGPAKDNEFVDLREIYFSPKPTTENGRLPLDHRDGLVDDRQGKLCAVYKRDGVTLPDYKEYLEHQARIQPGTWPEIENDINRLVSLLGRLIRYSSHATVLWSNDDIYGYPSMMPNTMEDIGALTDQICELIKSGMKISEFKIEEFMNNIVVACHNSQNHLTIIAKQLRSNDLTSLLTHADSISAMHTREPLSPNTSDGMGVVYSAKSGETIWTSGIFIFLSKMQEDVQQYNREHKEENRAFQFNPQLPPNGSPLAQLLWILEPRNN